VCEQVANVLCVDGLLTSLFCNKQKHQKNIGGVSKTKSCKYVVIVLSLYCTTLLASRCPPLVALTPAVLYFFELVVLASILVC
jgi:hypothetical protein